MCAHNLVIRPNDSSSESPLKFELFPVNHIDLDTKIMPDDDDNVVQPKKDSIAFVDESARDTGTEAKLKLSNESVSERTDEKEDDDNSSSLRMRNVEPAHIRTDSQRLSSNSDANFLSVAELEAFARQEKHKKAKKYYLRQSELVKSYRDDSELVEKFVQDEKEQGIAQTQSVIRRADEILAKVTLAVNIVLLTGKIVAAVLSGSYVVLGSVIDSATDITTGLVIYLTNRAIKKRDLYKYPRGRTRLEPIALIIISVIMGAANVQVISKSLESITKGAADPNVELPTIIIMVATIVIKFFLMLVCYMYRSPETAVMAQDHRNDCISNTVAILCAFLAHKYWPYLDPIAAILVSVYILITWFRTGLEHIRVLSGKTASPAFINRIVKICVDHQPPFKQVDTVYAYHYGTKFLVEVDVVLDENLSLKEAHDIAEPLQRKIEHLPDVERAFVHIDYETDHRPEHEHKVV